MARKKRTRKAPRKAPVTGAWSARHCFIVGQLLDRVEFSAQAAAWALGDKPDATTARVHAGVAAAEAERLSGWTPHLQERVGSLVAFAQALEKETGKKVKAKQARALRERFFALRDRTRAVMDDAESACPL